MDHDGTDRPPYDVIFHLRETGTASFCETNKKTTQAVGVGSYVSTTNTNKKRNAGVNMLFAFQIIHVTSF